MPFSNDDDHLRVRLRNVTVEVQCGVHPWEKHPERPTKLIINVDLYAGLKKGPLKPQIYIDYDKIRDFLKSLSKRPHVDLLETLADEIVAQCFLFKPVESCRVSILKQTIFNEAEGAGIEVLRTRSAWEGRA
jgi:7,8-dihydroneopterin aldolase/epimerase/oxygenase